MQYSRVRDKVRVRAPSCMIQSIKLQPACSVLTVGLLCRTKSTSSTTLGLTPSIPAVPNCCCSRGTVPSWSNPPFLIYDIRALWRSLLSARAPECQKLKMMGQISMAKCKALTGSEVKGLSSSLECCWSGGLNTRYVSWRFAGEALYRDNLARSSNNKRTQLTSANYISVHVKCKYWLPRARQRSDEG